MQNVRRCGRWQFKTASYVLWKPVNGLSVTIFQPPERFTTLRLLQILNPER
mgnify:CR=1 FL=1